LGYRLALLISEAGSSFFSRWWRCVKDAPKLEALGSLEWRFRCAAPFGNTKFSILEHDQWGSVNWFAILRTTENRKSDNQRSASWWSTISISSSSKYVQMRKAIGKAYHSGVLDVESFTLML
jgi:hypothetical protein